MGGQGTRTYPTDFLSIGRHNRCRARFFLRGIMSNPLNRAEHTRDPANEYRRLAANDSSAETRNYYLYMVKNYSTLAKAVKVKTTRETREQRLAF
jgi:hypothetical protein